MKGARAVILPCGKRLHLQHGPIDLIVEADQNRHLAYCAAKDRFETVLEELVSELAELKEVMTPQTSPPQGIIARQMHNVTQAYVSDIFLTRMIAVAGAVADTIMEAMKAVGPLKRAYVNNGGDIALHLEEGQQFEAAISSFDGTGLGRISIKSEDNIGGIATSGRNGRSFSLGIADSVTVLAHTAAKADVAATLIANTVDLPEHPMVQRVAAQSLDPDSDLGEKLVVVDCKLLKSNDQEIAISKGELKARQFKNLGLINSAAIFLQDENRLVGHQNLLISKRTPEYA